MIIALGFTYLVAVAVLEGVTGIPEKHNNIEEQLEDNAVHGSPMDSQVRKLACKNLGGKCIKTKKGCSVGLPHESQPGSPYCAKRRRCCYLDTEFLALQPQVKESEEFALQHIESGLWVQPESTENGQVLRLSEVLSDMSKYKVEIRPDTLLAHVKHVASGRYWHPERGSSEPKKGSTVVTWRTAPFYSLFTFNQATNIIKHQRGLNLRSRNSNNSPGGPLILWNNAFNAHFKAVNYSDPSKEFLIYGNADVTAYWQVIFSLDTPARATHTHTETVTVGHSISESSTTKATFAWEVTAKAQYWFAEMSASVSVANEVTKSSAETWSKITTQTVHIEVIKGEKIALWQRIFKASQIGHFSVQLSNQYAHTANSSIKPDDKGASSTIFHV